MKHLATLSDLSDGRGRDLTTVLRLPCRSASHNVTFTVVSGPDRIIAVGNGDPTNHHPSRVAWRSAFHGLVRGIVKVTTDAEINLALRV